MIANNLVEILLTAVFTFNVGAYTFLWNKMRNVEKDVDENSDSLNMILRRMFGIERDETQEGHLVETQEEFDKLHSKLEEICKKIDRESETREEEFKMIEGQLDVLFEELSQEEELDFEKKFPSDR